MQYKVDKKKETSPVDCYSIVKMEGFLLDLLFFNIEQAYILFFLKLVL